MDKTEEKLLADRAYEILMGNVYGREGYPWSPYRCTAPDRSHFRGIWNWDSAFHAVGLAQWDGALAWENILGFFQFQKANGMLPDVIYEDGRVVDTFSKPPVFAWAVEEVHRRAPNEAHLREIYPKLVSNQAFWRTHRQDRGLYHYDADFPERPDYEKRVRFESGLDNSVRWDQGVAQYWAIDLNCYMVLTFQCLCRLAALLGLEEDRQRWQKDAADLAVRIQETLWDPALGIFNDVNRHTGAHSPVRTPAIFMPLFVRIATREQAASLARVAREHFHGKMPTVAFDDPEYSRDYWRGPTWLNVAWFAARGLQNYGFPIAQEIRDNILTMCALETGGIFENYDSLTGQGLCCKRFSWSCVFILEFLWNWQEVPLCR